MRFYVDSLLDWFIFGQTFSQGGVKIEDWKDRKIEAGSRKGIEE
jgi:hypothetical protein